MVTTSISFIHKLIVFILLLLISTLSFAYLDVTDVADSYFWIGDPGPSGPIFSGPHQYPFICYSYENDLGQPLVDNQDGAGNAVFQEDNGVLLTGAEPVGYSKNCSIATRVDYFYYNTRVKEFLPLNIPPSSLSDVEHIEINGQSVKFIVRLERGTINRFLFSIAMLAPFTESLDSPKLLNLSAWNRKLVYKFQGGGGIGHWQGNFSLTKEQALLYDALKRGFAVAYSTGTSTSTHYNMTLAEETALMLKAHFESIYGTPESTIGVGASGGGLQQYVIAQNNPNIIDGAIAQVSYPDMVTQTIYVGDCELLERYFDFEYFVNSSSRWGNWLQRSVIEGLASSNSAIVEPWSSIPYAPYPGSDACVHGWRGAEPAFLNPAWTFPQYLDALQLYRYPADVIAAVKWSYFNDLNNIYPQNQNGVAYSTWDNVGVQYGLRALVSGKINSDEFIKINACVGGWKTPDKMRVGNYPWDLLADPTLPDPWDMANMNVNPLTCLYGEVAPRTNASVAAINAAYTSGQVFVGNINIPVLDVRWNLEPVIDKHNTIESFVSRSRILAATGNYKLQKIWFAECSDLDLVSLDKNCAFNPTGKALDVMDQWISNLQSADINAHIPPAEAVDTCFDGQGNLIYAGEDAWNGIIDSKAAGPCTVSFPLKSTSRIMAGGSIKGDIFKCRLKSLRSAIANHDYGNAKFSFMQLLMLNTIFPDGVCDYNLPGIGIP